MFVILKFNYVMNLSGHFESVRVLLYLTIFYLFMHVN